MWSGKDSGQLADILKEEFENTEPEERPVAILVDEIGYGAGVLDQARRAGLPVRGVNVSRRPMDDTKYFQLRDELWFKLRKWMETGSIAADHASLAAESRRVEYIELRAWVKEMATEQKEMAKSVNRLATLQEKRNDPMPASSTGD